ncbi:MAG: YceI family protein [Ignavibacteriales bacterium]|nr:MAG: YceI family protein [Ignavibacteriales bacterium]
MFKALSTIVLFICVITNINAQSFNIPSKDIQVFDFKDTQERNQATFYSEARFENITGLTNDVLGKVSFDANDVKSTLKGEVSISTSSIKTGIEKRDEHLRSVSWLNSEKYPNMTFKIKEITQIDQIEDNLLKIILIGEFTLRGKTKLVYANSKMKYLVESETTKHIMPGDLISVVASFDIKLSDFGITNSMIPNRVSDKIQITANLVGSNIN